MELYLVTDEGTEDIFDLEDQLKEVQLRRRIRAAKRKAKARLRTLTQMNFTEA